MENFYNHLQFPQLREIISNYKTIKEEFVNLNIPIMNIDR